MSFNVNSENQSITSLIQKISPLTWVSGFLILLIYQAIDSSVTNVVESLFRSIDGTPNWVWFIAGFSVLVNIAFPVLLTFWLLSSVKTTRDWAGDFQQMIIESLRAWGKILLYTLALVIPGIWKWVSTLFVPYVVLFSKDYPSGQIDAISMSAALFKKVWLRTVSVLVIFSMVIPYVMTTSFDQYREIWNHPVGATLIGLVDYVSISISLFLLLKFFITASREVKNELVF